MMKLQLSQEDQDMLNGRQGPATQMAMSIIVRMAEFSKAERLIDVHSAHIDSSIYTGDASLNFAEKLVELGARVKVPSTLSASSIDQDGWSNYAVPQEFAEKAGRQMLAYEKMGCIPVWTCAPYQSGFRPEFGQQVAWSESNAVVFINSVIGARTERYPDFLDICIAITGRTPEVGLHLTENRAGNILFDLLDVSEETQNDDTFYPILGYLAGSVCQDKIPVFINFKTRPGENQLKSMGAAAASSGGTALFHIVGFTPEAPTLEAAFQNKFPEKEIKVNHEMLEEAYQQLSTTTSQELDMVVLGCPHFSAADFERLAELAMGKKCHPNVQFLITTSRKEKELAEKNGHLQIVEAFGMKISTDSCVLISPMIADGVKTIMTNSGKCAYYGPGQLNKNVHFSSLKDCVNSAAAGYVIKEKQIWKE